MADGSRNKSELRQGSERQQPPQVTDKDEVSEENPPDGLWSGGAGSPRSLLGASGGTESSVFSGLFVCVCTG